MSALDFMIDWAIDFPDELDAGEPGETRKVGEAARVELDALRAERDEAVRLVRLLKESIDEIAYVLHDADRNTEEKVRSAKKVWLFFPVTRVTEFLAKVKP